MNDFLPTNYEVPSTSDKYMKLVKGDNRFRIMSSPILGYEIWVEKDDKRTPKRTPMDKPFTTSEVENPEDIRHFWAMVVYNYANQKIQILEITQKGIQKTLRALAQDVDWGSPVQKYDIVISRVGDGMDTKYEVLPKPATKMDEGIVQLFNDMNINLKALYTGGDPFESKDETVTDKDITDIESGMEKLKKAVPGK